MRYNKLKFPIFLEGERKWEGAMKYQGLEFKITYFECDDVVTTSGEHSDWNADDDNIINGWEN